MVKFVRNAKLLTSISDGEDPPHFHPEFGRFMLEATPGRPWGIDFKDLLKVESNMKWRSGKNLFKNLHCIIAYFSSLFQA